MKNKDKNLQKAIDDLPKYEPKDDLWNHIESALDNQKMNVGNAQTDKATKPKSLFAFAMWKGKTKAKFAMAASVVLAAVGGTWLYQNSQNQTSSDAELLADIQKVSNVKPVFSNTDVAFKHLVVNTEKGANFKLPNGTKIVVPQDAFVDKNNKPIVGNVDLEYREFHNAAQILASGIPMTYDSAGVKHQFESAGMFEMRGFQNNEPVFIAQNKGIDVDMASFVKGDDFRFYYLDQTNTKTVAYHSPFFTSAYAQTATGNDTNNNINNSTNNSTNDTTNFVARTGNSSGYWKYLGINESKNNEDKTAKIDSAVAAFSKEYMAKIEAEKAAIAAEREKIQDEDITLNRKTKRAINSANFFRLKFETATYPELEPFRSMIWEYTGEKNENRNPRSAKNEWILEKQWREIELTKRLFQPMALAGHPGDVNDVEFSPNGKFIATAAGGGAKLWDKNGKLLFNLDGHPGIVKQVDFSSDSKLILTVAEGLINLWNTEGLLLQTFGNNPNIISNAVFSQDNKKIVAYIGNHTKVWDLKGNLIANIESYDGQKLSDFVELPSYTTPEYSFRIAENKIQILKNGSIIKILKGHQNDITKVEFSKDGKFLVTSALDRMIKVWSIAEDFKLISNLRMFETSKVNATFVAISPDNQAILSIGNNERNKNVFKDDAVYLWKRINPQDDAIYELSVYCKPMSQSEIKEFGDNISFTTTVYREEGENQTVSFKDNPMLAKRIKNLDEVMSKYYQAVNARREAEEIRLVNEANLLRNYTVVDFGIHNWDRPFERENLVSIAANFELDSKITSNITQYNNIQVYFVTGENGTVVQRLPLTKRNLIRFPKNVNSQFVLVLPNNQVAIFSAEEFKTSVLDKWQDLKDGKTAKQNEFTFKFNTLKPVSSVDDLQSYLKVKS